MVRKRPLSDEEKTAWDEAAQDVQKLKRKKLAPPAATKKLTVAPRHFAPIIPHASYDMPLEVGSYAGVDKNTANRFRKGETPMDGTLDLHGLTAERAHRALTGFLHQHYGQSSRNLLVITGKSGILREALPRWLAEADIRGIILAFDVAKAKHGGHGAYYILLKRKRITNGA